MAAKIGGLSSKLPDDVAQKMDEEYNRKKRALGTAGIFGLLTSCYLVYAVDQGRDKHCEEFKKSATGQSLIAVQKAAAERGEVIDLNVGLPAHGALTCELD